MTNTMLAPAELLFDEVRLAEPGKAQAVLGDITALAVRTVTTPEQADAFLAEYAKYIRQTAGERVVTSSSEGSSREVVSPGEVAIRGVRGVAEVMCRFGDLKGQDMVEVLKPWHRAYFSSI